MGNKYGTQTDTTRIYTTADEATDPKLVNCPNCTVNVVPRGINSTRKDAAGEKHCPNCGHVFGRANH